VISYRVARRSYASLGGEGARQYGGRYNPRGIPAVYTSQSIALSVLEVLVHIDKSEVPADYVVMAIRFPGRRVLRRHASLVGSNKLTVEAFRNALYRWPVVCVPSIIVPREYNFVLLPGADGFAAKIEWIEPLSFDRRLLSLG
jgi:RES domain-containing protein